MKEFLLLIREDLQSYGKMTEEEMQADIENHIAWVETLVNKGHFKSGNPLTANGNCIKGKSQLITDGPYAESKEAISGYYFLLANSLQEATEIAKGCPSLAYNATLEIREVMNTDEQ